MEIVTALALRKQKKLCTESYLTRSSHFQRCPSGAFRSARVTNSIKIEDQPNDQTLRKSPTYWTGSKSIFWLMMKTIIVHTKYVSFTTRPLHLINPHICVWVTLYVKHKRFLCSWFLVSSDFSAGFFALLRYWQNTCNRSTYLSVGAQGKISGSLRFLHLASAYNTEENQMLYV